MTHKTTYQLFVGGRSEPAASGKTFEVINPATEETVALVSEGDAEDIDRAVAAAQEGHAVWGRMTGEQRAEIMNRAAMLLRKRLSEFVDVEVAQTGRPVREMSAQLARLPEWYEYFGAVARTYEPTVPPFGPSHLNYLRRLPLGVVGHVTPWNHPLLILTKKVAPAMAAGNSMVVKPSELAPLTPIMLAEVFQEAGLPEGVYNVVPGFGPTAGKALTSHQAIRKVDLTGGTETGRVVAAAAGHNLIPVGAELGGKASVVVFDDVEIEEAVSAAMFAAFVAAGQTCVQGARILVQRSMHARFLERLIERVESIRLGDPTDSRTQMGPLISERQRAVTEKYVTIGREEGAHLVTGGERPHGSEFERGFWFLPTVFTDVRNDMRIAQDEIFGPVTCVLPFDTEADAVSLANGTAFGLSSSVWTRDLARGHRVAHALDCGIVWVNDHHRIGPASPWGGFKDSGLGRENGIVAYEQYTEVQNIVVNLSSESFDWFADDGEPKRYS